MIDFESSEPFHERKTMLLRTRKFLKALGFMAAGKPKQMAPTPYELIFAVVAAVCFLLWLFGDRVWWFD